MLVEIKLDKPQMSLSMLSKIKWKFASESCAMEDATLSHMIATDLQAMQPIGTERKQAQFVNAGMGCFSHFIYRIGGMAAL